MKSLIRGFQLMLLIIPCASCLFSCDADEPDSGEPMLIVKFRFDESQQRLDNSGQPSRMALGNAALTPNFHEVSAHYIELVPDRYRQLGEGTVLYHAPETQIGGDNAIDFGKARIVSGGETFLKIPLHQIAAGNYSWVRVSVAYQKYGLRIRHTDKDMEGTLVSFIGPETYISSHAIGNNFFEVNQNKQQGYWAFALNDYPYSLEGQTPQGTTTVPNPLAASSPIPPGSCVVTGQFVNKLVINGNETKDVTVTLSLSVNNSFEWREVRADGKFEPSIGEDVVDMGIRGLRASYK